MSYLLDTNICIYYLNGDQRLAERILAAREERPFSALEEVERVSGIGPGKRKKLEGLATC